MSIKKNDVQEAGRGGRDGSVADAVLLWSHKDSAASEKYKIGSRERVLKEFAESNSCRRQVLLDALGGEEAACSGCDICKRGAPAPKARDAEIIMKLLRKNRRRWTMDELNFQSAMELNKKVNDSCEIVPYEHSDTEEIISQLKEQSLIKVCSWPFKNLVTCK